MSQWTHVNSAIRFDGIGGITPVPDCGTTVTFDDDDFDKCTVPCGSEGSLTISEWVNPESGHMARYTYSIFGDLRDYDDEQEIIDYFSRIVKGYLVRDGFFTIEVEGRDHRSFIYVKDGFKELAL